MGPPVFCTGSAAICFFFFDQSTGNPYPVLERVDCCVCYLVPGNHKFLFRVYSSRYQYLVPGTRNNFFFDWYNTWYQVHSAFYAGTALGERSSASPYIIAERKFCVSVCVCVCACRLTKPLQPSLGYSVGSVRSTSFWKYRYVPSTSSFPTARSAGTGYVRSTSRSTLNAETALGARKRR
jgi:hypothetical protein